MPVANSTHAVKDRMRCDEKRDVIVVVLYFSRLIISHCQRVKRKAIAVMGIRDGGVFRDEPYSVIVGILGVGHPSKTEKQTH